eukprot:jgi/Ulvmu1/8361/UM042_0067.1
MAAQSRRPVGCLRSCLRGSLRGLNYLLAIIGVLMVAYSLFMYVQWSEATPSPPAPPPSPAPAPTPSSAPGLHQHASLQNGISTVSDDTKQDSAGIDDLTSSSKRADGVSASGDDKEKKKHTKYPWFIYAVGGAGLGVFLTASVGIASADCAACGVTCFLGLYHALMVLLLLLQVSVVCFYFFDKSWEEDLPPDTTGEYAKLREMVLHHIRACQMVALATLGLQLLALMVSCSLYYAENKPHYEYRVLHADYESASQVAGPSGRRGHGNGARDAWSARNSAKYGAAGSDGGTSRGYDPEVGRAAGTGDDDVAEPHQKRGCTIM